MERERIRSKNTSFSTDLQTFRAAKGLAVLEDISLSELIDRALQREVERLSKKHRQNRELAQLLVSDEAIA